MDCYCNSKHLYRSDYTHPEQTILVDGHSHLKKRFIDTQMVANSHPSPAIEAKIEDCASIWLPKELDRISWDQVTFNPLWFTQKYLSKNIPCIITDVLQGDDIFERWAEPQYLCESVQDQKHSVSLTPDGFADSINGSYFVEPHEEKCSLDKFFNHEEHFPDAVPYIQHQNGNFTEQFGSLSYEVSQQIVKHVSIDLFKGKEPDAENIWLGYDKSVSSLHKDPYENFYIPIVGEKHFTLMPPHSVLSLEEQPYKTAKWNYTKQAQKASFDCQVTEDINKWICVNPDLDKDQEKYPSLKGAQSYHVTVKKEEMLYLPSLWYHQVSQCRVKDPYTLALNYWFDMEFSHNYALYETCRSLRNLD